MTAHHRPLARLPLEVFEPLVAAFAAGPVFASGGGFGGGNGIDDCDCDPAVDPRPAARIEERHARWGEEEFGGGGSDEEEGPMDDEDSFAASSRIVATLQRKRRRRSTGGDVGAGPEDARTATTTTTTKMIRQQICSKLVASSTAASARLPQDALAPSHARTNPPRHGVGSTAAAAADGATTTAAPFHDGGMGEGDFDAATVVTANVPFQGDSAATPAPGSAATTTTATASAHSIRTVGQLLSTDAHDLMRKLDPLLTAGTYVRHWADLAPCSALRVLLFIFLTPLPDCHFVCSRTLSMVVAAAKRPDECRLLLRRVASHCAPPAVSAFSLLQQLRSASARHPHGPRRSARFVSTCIPALDRHLRGGMEVGRIFEAYGASGSGKTQLALSAAVQNALERKGATVYIDTPSHGSGGAEAGGAASPDGEPDVPAAVSSSRSLSGLVLERLRDIASHRLASTTSTSSSITAATILSNVVSYSVGDATELLRCIDSLEEEIVLRNHEDCDTIEEPMDCVGTTLATAAPKALPINLIVLDSLAQPLRSETLDPEAAGASGAASLSNRAAYALAVAQRLKRIAMEHNVAVLVINHIDMVQSSTGYPGAAAEAGGGGAATDRIAPAPPAALGTAWHHCVSTRVALQHRPCTIPMPPTGASSSQPPPSLALPQLFDRTAVLTKSSVVPCPAGPFGFGIRSRGVVGEVKSRSAAAQSNY
jgi:Rad51